MSKSVDAKYNASGPTLHLGNPFTESLPPILTDEELCNELDSIPELDMQRSRDLRMVDRIYELDGLDEIYLPPPESLDMARSVDTLLRKSYAQRNPLTPSYVASVYSAQNTFKNQQSLSMVGMLAIQGMSGMGKTQFVRRVLSLYPQVIHHEAYKGRSFVAPQVVWLSVEAPIGGSLKGFIFSLFQALDDALDLSGSANSHLARINPRSSHETLMSHFVQVASTYALGILHIDDIQRIAEIKSHKDHVLQSMIRLANTAKFGVLFSGTHEMNLVINSMVKNETKKNSLIQNFEMTRRTTSRGFFDMKRASGPDDPFYIALVRRLLEYQWLDVQLQPEKQLLDMLFDLSAGIPAILTNLHRFAQEIALSAGSSALTPNHYLSAYDHRMQPMHELLSSIRNGQLDQIKGLKRVVPRSSTDGFCL